MVNQWLSSIDIFSDDDRGPVICPKAIEFGRDVDVDDITLLQQYVGRRYTVGDNVVDADTCAARKAVYQPGCRSRSFRRKVGFADNIELFRTDAGADFNDHLV